MKKREYAARYIANNVRIQSRLPKLTLLAKEKFPDYYYKCWCLFFLEGNLERIKLYTELFYECLYYIFNKIKNDPFHCLSSINKQMTKLQREWESKIDWTI